MENKKICPECKTSFPPTRSDQVFCKTTCRWNAWRKRKAKNKGQDVKALSAAPQPETPDLYSTLRGVGEPNETELKQEPIHNNPEEKKPEPPKIADPVAIETKQYKEAIAEKTRVDAFVKRVLSNLEACDKEILQQEEALERLSSGNTRSKNDKYSAWHADIEDLFGDEYEDMKLSNQFRLEENQKRLDILKNAKNEFLKELNKANKVMDAITNRLKTTAQFEKPITVVENKPSLLSLLNGIKTNKTEQLGQVNELSQKQGKTQENNAEQSENIPAENNQSESIPANDKFVSSSQLRRRKYKTFPFLGKWKEFFGQPSYRFHLAVHGLPGEGKSTFCIQFADYLAKEFGKVVYISGEEGLEMTLRDKVINSRIDNPYLIFADIKSYDEIKTEIKSEYHFIFIDSLETFRIDPIKLKELKQLYPQSAFITISQSTKDGNMRGSQEIAHDSDITVKVENGKAITKKNRFHKRGMEFKIEFPDSDKSLK